MAQKSPMSGIRPESVAPVCGFARVCLMPTFVKTQPMKMKKLFFLCGLICIAALSCKKSNNTTPKKDSAPAPTVGAKIGLNFETPYTFTLYYNGTVYAVDTVIFHAPASASVFAGALTESYGTNTVDYFGIDNTTVAGTDKQNDSACMAQGMQSVNYIALSIPEPAEVTAAGTLYNMAHNFGCRIALYSSGVVCSNGSPQLGIIFNSSYYATLKAN